MNRYFGTAKKIKFQETRTPNHFTRTMLQSN